MTDDDCAIWAVRSFLLDEPADGPPDFPLPMPALSRLLALAEECLERRRKEAARGDAE